MLQIYKVRIAFEAKQLNHEPLRIEAFDPGDLLVVLSSDGSYTIFCHHDDASELDARDQFIAEDQEFQQCVEAL